MPLRHETQFFIPAWRGFATGSRNTSFPQSGNFQAIPLAEKVASSPTRVGRQQDKARGIFYAVFWTESSTTATVFPTSRPADTASATACPDGQAIRTGATASACRQLRHATEDNPAATARTSPDEASDCASGLRATTSSPSRPDSRTEREPPWPGVFRRADGRHEQRRPDALQTRFFGHHPQ